MSVADDRGRWRGMLKFVWLGSYIIEQILLQKNPRERGRGNFKVLPTRSIMTRVKGSSDGEDISTVAKRDRSGMSKVAGGESVRSGEHRL